MVVQPCDCHALSLLNIYLLERPRFPIWVPKDVLLLNSFTFNVLLNHIKISVFCYCVITGVHRAEEGHQEDVCHEVHEQAEMC